MRDFKKMYIKLAYAFTTLMDGQSRWHVADSSIFKNKLEIIKAEIR